MNQVAQDDSLNPNSPNYTGKPNPRVPDHITYDELKAQSRFTTFGGWARWVVWRRNINNKAKTI